MRHFIMVNTLHIPRENQLRAAAVLEHVLQTKGQILGFGRALMAGRWARLRTCFATASRLRVSTTVLPRGLTKPKYPLANANEGVGTTSGRTGSTS